MAKTTMQWKPAKRAAPGDAGAAGGDGEGKKEKKTTTTTRAESDAASAGELVISVPVHCDGCARKLRRSVQRLDGVEEVTVDCRTNTVVVRGPKAAEDPAAIVEVVDRRTGKKALVLSSSPAKPKPPPSPEKKGTEATKKDASSDQGMDKEMAEDDLEMVVVMRIDLHCEACCEEIKRRVLKIKGVEEVVPHMKSSQVTVRGKIEPATLAGLIHKWTGRRAAIFRAEPLLQQPSPSPPPSPPKVDEGHPEAAPEPVPEKEETKEGDQPPSSDDAQEKEGAAAEEKEKEEEGEPVDEEEEGRGELQNENPIFGAAGSSNGAAEESHTATTTNGHLFRAAVQEPVAAVAPESEKTATGNQLYQCRYYYYPAYTYDAYPCPQYRDQFQQQNYSYAAGYPPAMYGYYPRHVPEAFSDENPNVCSVM